MVPIAERPSMSDFPDWEALRSLPLDIPRAAHTDINIAFPFGLPPPPAFGRFPLSSCFLFFSFLP
jgi:hypothetical protein